MNPKGYDAGALRWTKVVPRFLRALQPPGVTHCVMSRFHNVHVPIPTLSTAAHAGAAAVQGRSKGAMSGLQPNGELCELLASSKNITIQKRNGKQRTRADIRQAWVLQTADCVDPLTLAHCTPVPTAARVIVKMDT